MNQRRDVFTIGNVKKGIIVCLQLTIGFGLVFGILFNDFSWDGLWKSFVISGMFSFGMGFGNGLINSYLSTKWDWITQTNQRVTAGIIATVLYTIPLVLAIDYVTLIVLNDVDPSRFFEERFF